METLLNVVKTHRTIKFLSLEVGLCLVTPVDLYMHSELNECTALLSCGRAGSRDGAVVEHLPPTNVARVRFPDSVSYVG